MTTRYNQVLAKWLVFLVLAAALLLAVAQGNNAEPSEQRLGQAAANEEMGSDKKPVEPGQMWSKVNYDSSLTDPFFESNEWSYPWYIIKHPDGNLEDTTNDTRLEKEPPRLKHTAKCFSTSLGSEHPVRFCEARLLDVNLIDLLIHESNPAFNDTLRVRIQNVMFTSAYSTAFKVSPRVHPGAIWMMKRQELTLDKKAYRKGDVIKGRIDIEYIQEITDLDLAKHFSTNPSKIRFYGVFKTTVE